MCVGISKAKRRQHECTRQECRVEEGGPYDTVVDGNKQVDARAHAIEREKSKHGRQFGVMTIHKGTLYFAIS